MKVTKSVYTDKFEFCDAQGNVIKTIPFTINITSTCTAVTKKQHELATVNEEDVEAVGKSFVELLMAIFGGQVTHELLDYYSDDYFALVADITPTLVDDIFPLFDQYRKHILAAKKKVKK